MVDKENEPPVPKKQKLSLSLKKKDKKRVQGESSRWNFISEEEESSLSTLFVPKNTESSTKWALSNFMQWKMSRNEQFCEEREKQVPDDILETACPEILCKWLGLYVAETRKIDGSCYPPKTLYILLTGLLRHMRTLNPNCPNFLDMSNH